MNAQDRHYAEQGYHLPDGLTWKDVQDHRQRWEIEPWMVPVAQAGGAIAWGVPFKDGKPLKRLAPTRPDGKGIEASEPGVV